MSRTQRHSLIVVRGHQFHLEPGFLGYLHGDIKNSDQVEAACYYEYARESGVLRRLADERDRMNVDMKAHESFPTEFTRLISEASGWIPWVDILDCRGFWKTSWNDLKKDERESVAMAFGKPKSVVLRAAWQLDAMGVMARMNALNPKAPAVIQDGSVIHALVEIDVTKGKTRIMNDFSMLVGSIHRDTRDNQHDKRRFLDRLKDLASWRLFRELNNSSDDANYFASKNRLGGYSPKPFLGARSPSGDLGDDDYFRRAKGRCLEFIHSIMPGEAKSDKETASELRQFLPISPQ